MGENLSEKIIGAHKRAGNMSPGEEVCIIIDQTLTQDATGTMAYLQFEAIGLSRVMTKLSVSYVDHNMLQTGFENADDHLYLQSVASKYGIYFSRAGNGICHQVHLERFSVPGDTLLGSDSHTPTCGGIGMLAIGAGGLDIAVAMASKTYYFTYPNIVNVRLSHALSKCTSAKDVILYLLKEKGVKGGIGKILEYTGDGVKTLEVTERATISNMGTEVGATTSIVPSDEKTREYLRAQKRENDCKILSPEPDAEYDETWDVNLSHIEPLIACPHSPDNVMPVSEIAGTKVNQVAIGSCTNSSYSDLMKVAGILKGKRISNDVSLVIAPGSRQVLTAIALNGALSDLINSGARILESACGPCIGMGQAPPSNGVSLRTFNRNFEGRSGTKNARVYLCSPETAAVSALTGKITDPRDLNIDINIKIPETYHVDDSMIIPPPVNGQMVEIIMGPNIKPLPLTPPLPHDLRGRVFIKLGDNITTDHIMPAGAKLLPLRSNIPALSEHVFESIDSNFPERCREWGGGYIVSGENYGQGSSREHAVIAPMYLGLRCVIAKSFARIHRANLINFGIIPLKLTDENNYSILEQGDTIEIMDISDQLKNKKIYAIIKNKNIEIILTHDLLDREREIILAGGLLNYTRRLVGEIRYPR